MARVTVQDCLTRIPNRFELVLAAAKRARLLQQGAQSMVSQGNHKSTVIALREIAAGDVTVGILEDGSVAIVASEVKTEEVANPVSGETGESD